MSNKKAFETHNRNQNRLALRKARAEGRRKINVGLTYAEGGGAATVVYCGACNGPVVNDKIARRRHGMKSAACEAAMEGGSQ
jgi:hypothetical protein